MPQADDVEEIPCEEVPVKPDRDIQPPKVNTFFSAEATERKAKKENKKLKKAILAMNGSSV